MSLLLTLNKFRVFFKCLYVDFEIIIVCWAGVPEVLKTLLLLNIIKSFTLKETVILKT